MVLAQDAISELLVQNFLEDPSRIGNDTEGFLASTYRMVESDLARGDYAKAYATYLQVRDVLEPALADVLDDKNTFLRSIAMSAGTAGESEISAMVYDDIVRDILLHGVRSDQDARAIVAAAQWPSQMVVTDRSIVLLDFAWDQDYVQQNLYAKYYVGVNFAGQLADDGQHARALDVYLEVLSDIDSPLSAGLAEYAERFGMENTLAYRSTIYNAYYAASRAGDIPMAAYLAQWMANEPDIFGRDGELFLQKYR